MSLDFFLEVTLKLLKGFSFTAEIFFVTLLLSLPLGLVVMLGSRSRFRPVALLTRAFVWVIRGTPLMLQIFIVFYGPGLLWESTMLPRMTAVLVAFVINYACYFSEIYRGGIEAIPRGQQEAAQVLGMSRAGTFFKVTLLQVVKRILPAMGNEIITLVKDTSLAFCIGVAEMFSTARAIVASQASMTPFLFAAAIYWVFNMLVELVLSRAEKSLDYYHE